MPIIVGQDKNVSKRATCKKCGAVNEYLPNEVRILSSGKDISGTMSVTKGFSCAQCGSEVITYAD